jgi:deoxyribonuclease-4
MLHLNDSKVPLGSRRDRHELIGEGAIGAGAFRRIMTDPRFARIPKVIETPKLDDPEATDRRMLSLLRGFAAESDSKAITESEAAETDAAVDRDVLAASSSSSRGAISLP